MDSDFAQCLKKQEALKEIFHEQLSSEERYLKIITFGKKLPPFPEEEKVEKNRVTGCQSLTYLSGYLQNQKMFFQAHSEALLTKGLAYVVLYIYQEQSVETILKCKPDFLNSLGILGSLSPTRAHGLKSFYNKLLNVSIKNLSLI
jgi:cysteine desulfuration protein SufE